MQPLAELLLSGRCPGTPAALAAAPASTSAAPTAADGQALSIVLAPPSTPASPAAAAALAAANGERSQLAAQGRLLSSAGPVFQRPQLHVETAQRINLLSQLLQLGGGQNLRRWVQGKGR